MTILVFAGLVLAISAGSLLLVFGLMRRRLLGRMREIEAANRAFQATFEQAVVGIAHLDAGGRWLRINRRFCEIAGRSRDELLPLTVDDITHPDDRERDRAEREAMMAGRLDHSAIEKRYVRKDGGIVWVSATRSAICGPDGRPEFFVAVVEEIGARKEAEAALRASQEQLLSLQNEFVHLARLNDLGEMASAIAHEINQPLTAIVNYLDTGVAIAGEGFSKESFAEVRQLLLQASQQALRAGDVVRRLRAFIGRKQGGRTVENADRLVDAAMALALIGARTSGILVERRAEAAGAMVEVDPVQLQQVLVNLLRNAVEALRRRTGEGEARLLVSTAIRPDGTIAFAVEDNGPGIAPELAGRLFEPFVTARPNGVGMGLSLCRRLVEAHGGAIEAESAPGRGATFRFHLPQYRARPF